MRFIVLLGLLAAPGLTQDWVDLTGREILAALSGVTLVYDAKTLQVFRPDGHTFYRQAGGESWGKWWVQGDRYCSTWPPSTAVSCYRVAAQDRDIRFTGSSGDVSIGRVKLP